MKTFLPAFVLLFLIVFPVKTQKDTQQVSLDGTWELVGHYLYTNNEVSDTIKPTYGYRQIKMFNNGKVMWTRYVPKDSVEWFGYGSYEATDSTLVETLEYGSASMMKIIDTMRVFKFKLELGKNYFRQITVDENGNRTFSENYKRLD